jgi:hypothetical protein
MSHIARCQSSEMYKSRDKCGCAVQKIREREKESVLNLKNVLTLGIKIA